MGKFVDKFKRGGEAIDRKANQIHQRRQAKPQSFRGGKIQRRNNNAKVGHEAIVEEEDYDEGYDDDFNDSYDNYDDVGIQSAQKPESFHHFILENQYLDLEKSIRGYKDVYSKDTGTWEVKRKDLHCFTDEEAEGILRTAQSHLATDIKLSIINKEAYGKFMMAIYRQLSHHFYQIAEYNYGRYGSFEKQYKMKAENGKIWLELWTRIQANYSRAISGAENKATHGSVKGQESLQSSERFDEDRRGYR